MSYDATLQEIRRLVQAHGRLRVPIIFVADSDDLSAAGLASFAAVQLLIAIEEEFGIEFSVIDPRAFDSISNLAEATRLQISRA